MIERYRKIKRIRKIVSVLIKYGFGELVAELKILPFSTALRKLFFLNRAVRDLTVPVRIRLVVEELGPSFVKLGQIASTRADILPPDWVEEFKKLQDMVPPTPSDEIRQAVEKSLKAPLSAKFASFDSAPVASASIAQVHLATLPDGSEVAVKVKRPGIERVIESDLSVMYTIAELLVRYVPASRRYRPIEVVDEFRRIIVREQDMTIEGANVNLFRKLFKDDKRIHIPRVYWDWTSNEVLTMERVTATPMDEVEKIRAGGLDIKKIALNGIEIFFKQVFEFGVFHADLHPGNIFVRDDGVIVYLDFGIVGRLDRNLRKYLASLLYYLVREDYYRMAAIHREMGLIHKGVDIAEFEEALRDISEPLFGRQLSHINVSTLLLKLIETARRFEMKLQPNLLLLQKSTVIIEGVGRQLYPDINIFEAAQPLITRWMIREKYSPKSVLRNRSEDMGELVDSIAELPARAGDFFDKAVNEELKIGFVHHRLDDLTAELSSAGKRVGWGVISASAALGASVMTAFPAEGAATLWGIPALGWIGYGISALLAVRVWFGR
jgi:ubiquinone biosynthesis protein